MRTLVLALLVSLLAFAAVPVAHADIPELAGDWHLDSNGAS
jgi:hypothetical protein